MFTLITTLIHSLLAKVKSLTGTETEPPSFTLMINEISPFVTIESRQINSLPLLFSGLNFFV